MRIPMSKGFERRTRPRGPQGLPLRVQMAAVMVLLALVPSLLVSFALIPLAFPDAWQASWPWFGAWIVGLAVVVVTAAVAAARVMVGPLSKIARELDTLRGHTDLRTAVQIRHADGDPREVASVKRSVLSLLQRVDEERERRATVHAMLTHDIHTSVLAMRNVIDLMAQGRLQVDGETATDLAREVGTLHDRTQQLIDMLRFDRVELALTNERLDARTLVQDAVTRVRAAAPSAVVSVNVSGDASFVGDRATLVRAIENLVGNALRHARSRVSVDIRPGAIRVTDDGGGFAASFDAATRSAEPDPGAPGSAAGSAKCLGLYLTRLIAEAHGGRLILEDTGPNGSTIGLHLAK
jgi:signal transduction histidine kinase